MSDVFTPKNASFPWRALLAICLLGCALRIGVVFGTADTNPATAQIWEYGDIAEFAHENGYLGRSATDPEGGEFKYPTAFMPPLPIFIWWLLFKLFGVCSSALGAFLALNVVLGTLVIYQGGSIAWRLFGCRTVALLSALLLAFYPTFLASVATYHALQIYLVLFLGGALVALRASKPSVGDAILLGVLGGLAALARTEYIALMVPLFLFRFWGRANFKLLLLSVAISAACVLPWTARNYVVLGRFIPVANATGFALFKGFNELANGSGDWVDNNEVLKNTLGEQLDAVPLTATYENDRDDVIKEHALAFIKNHPAEAFLWLPLKKQVLFWVFDYHDPMGWHPGYQMAFWPVLLLTVVGLVAAWRNQALSKRTWILLLGVFAAQALVMTLYAVHLRYRMNVEPFLFPFAAYAVSLAWKHLQAMRSPTPAPVGPCEDTA